MIYYDPLSADCFTAKAMCGTDIEAVRSAQRVFENFAINSSASHLSGMERANHIELFLHQQ